MRLSEIVATSTEATLGTGRCEIDDVVGYAWRNHRDDLTSESERLVSEALRRHVKEHLRRLSDDDNPNDGQLSLPGLHFPTAIAVKDEARHYYVRTDQATWDELTAGESEREQNVDRARTKLRLYRDSMERLRVAMEGTGRTVAEAIELTRAAA